MHITAIRHPWPPSTTGDAKAASTSIWGEGWRHCHDVLNDLLRKTGYIQMPIQSIKDRIILAPDHKIAQQIEQPLSKGFCAFVLEFPLLHLTKIYNCLSILCLQFSRSQQSDDTDGYRGRWQSMATSELCNTHHYCSQMHRQTICFLSAMSATVFSSI